MIGPGRCGCCEFRDEGERRKGRVFLLGYDNMFNWGDDVGNDRGRDSGEAREDEDDDDEDGFRPCDDAEDNRRGCWREERSLRGCSRVEEGAGREDEDERPEPEDVVVVSDGGLVDDDVEVDLETSETLFGRSKSEGEVERSTSSLRKACDSPNSLS